MSSAVQLVALPFAGGSRFSYQPLRPYLDDSIALHGIDYPGRGTRFGEPALTTFNALLDDVLKELKALAVGKELVLFGHSLGACLALEVAYRLLDEGRVRPRMLIVSGRPKPATSANAQGWASLSREEFLERLAAYGGMPEQMLADREMQDIFVPILRADFEVNGSYEYDPREPLPIPVVSLQGENDSVSSGGGVGWSDVAGGDFQEHILPGGHFFIFTDPEKTAATINLEARRVVS